MPQCPVCYKDIYSSKLKTIGDQMVCSLSCVGLLNGNETDSCQYCKRPVWKDNYYKINNKICCSEFCRDTILEKLNIPKNSNIIKHFQENIFMNINPTILKNTKQLREEVLKVYNDFQFDIIEDPNENQNSIEKEKNNDKRKEINDISDELNKYNKYNRNIKEHKSASDLKEYLKKNNHNYLLKSSDIDLYHSKYIRKNIINKIRNKVSENNDWIMDKNNYNKNKDKFYDTNNYIVKKSYNNIKNSNNKINEDKNKEKISDPDENINKYYSNDYYNYYNIYDKEIDYDYYKDSNRTIDNNNANSYYFDNYNKINSNELKNRNYNYSNDINGYSNYTQKNILKLNRKNNSTSKKTKMCKTCLKNLGSITFLDRNGNTFCSDNCKYEFLNSKNK